MNCNVKSYFSKNIQSLSSPSPSAPFVARAWAAGFLRTDAGGRQPSGLLFSPDPKGGASRGASIRNRCIGIQNIDYLVTVNARSLILQLIHTLLIIPLNSPTENFFPSRFIRCLTEKDPPRRRATSFCEFTPHALGIGLSWMIIQLMPNLSRNWPKRCAKKVSPIAMKISPPSASAL